MSFDLFISNKCGNVLSSNDLEAAMFTHGRKIEGDEALKPEKKSAPPTDN